MRDLIGGFFEAAAIGADIEELARRALDSYSQTAFRALGLWNILRRAAWSKIGFDAGLLSSGSDSSADREVNRSGRGTNVLFSVPGDIGISAGNSALPGYATMSELTGVAVASPVYDFPSSVGGMVSGLTSGIPKLFDGFAPPLRVEFAGSDARFSDTAPEYGSSALSVLKTVFKAVRNTEMPIVSDPIKGPAERIYRNVLSDGLNDPQVFENFSFFGSDIPLSEVVGTGDDTSDNEKIITYVPLKRTSDPGIYPGVSGFALPPGLIESSAGSAFYNSTGYLEMPEMPRDERILLRSAAVRDRSNASEREQAGLYRGEDRAGIAGRVDLDEMIDYLANGVKTALESAAEGVHN